MYHFVYLIVTRNKQKIISYVGYSTNVLARLYKHNASKGAKATKGYKWKIIYKKRFLSKSKALSFEYKLKKDRKKRKLILNDFNKSKN